MERKSMFEENDQAVAVTQHDDQEAANLNAGLAPQDRVPHEFTDEITTIYIEDIDVGLSRMRSKTITQRDLELFGEVSGDMNPVHFDDEYANGTMFKGRIVHGMLTASLISAVIGQQLPGQGTVYLKQDLTFLAPVRPGDVVDAKVTVTEVNLRRGRVSLDCQVSVGDTVVLKGAALVMAPSRGEAAQQQ
jgi:3-hydroxybutyryl-CoA dehydratase